jgi:hypothetical protein
MNLKERNKQIKKAVMSAYPNDKVSVTGGRGTATGWVDVKLTLKTLPGCSCKFIENHATWAKVPYTYITRSERQPRTGDYYNDQYTYYCPQCHERLEVENKKLKDIVYNCGAEFYHYTVDDGYNTQSAECLVSVEIEKN